MQKTRVAVDEMPAAPPITPDGLVQLKKEDMKLAVVERFKVSLQTPKRTSKRKGRSPYWQAADEEC